MAMSAGYNAFEPDDLTLAQTLLDEVWASLPSNVREGSRSTIFREQLARQILSAMNNGAFGREELKTSLVRADRADWN
jgi:hypothetical protein